MDFTVDLTVCFLLLFVGKDARNHRDLSQRQNHGENCENYKTAYMKIGQHDQLYILWCVTDMLFVGLRCESYIMILNGITE